MVLVLDLEQFLDLSLILDVCLVFLEDLDFFSSAVSSIIPISLRSYKIPDTSYVFLVNRNNSLLFDHQVTQWA